MKEEAEYQACLTELKVLEHSTLKAQYETLNKKYRNAQKTIDRELSHVNGAVTELGLEVKRKRQEGQLLTRQEACDILDTVAEKLKTLKRKATEAVSEEMEVTAACRRRVDYLEMYPRLSPAEQEEWRRARVDRLLVEHFLQQGYYDTATRLADLAGIRDLTNLDIFLQSQKIEESLARHETALCLTWCHDNRSKLRKARSTLEFDLRQQEFIELIRANKKMEAVLHSRKYFSSTDSMHLASIQKTLGLLAFTSGSTAESYKELMDTNRWLSLVTQFRRESFSLHQLNDPCPFMVTLQCGLSALKTPYCYKEATKNPNCPVCTPKLNQLAAELPFSHTGNSKLLCKMSGDIMNENNPPLMLPSGHVYGTQELQARAAANGGRVTCLRSQEEYGLDQAEKVYIM